jgi:hypothetical protein
MRGYFRPQLPPQRLKVITARSMSIGRDVRVCSRERPRDRVSCHATTPSAFGWIISRPRSLLWMARLNIAESLAST